MRIGIPKEIKASEYRVGLTPAGVDELVQEGHQVFVEKDLGVKIGYDDTSYQEVGAKVVEDCDRIYETADLVVKVKEPQLEECKKLRYGQILFTYLHLANDLAQTKLLQESGCSAIAYETITDSSNRLPLLAPMSEIAGRMSVQVGANALHMISGGRGILLGGVAGVLPAKVVVLGGGASGLNAARMAMGLGADVVVLDKSRQVLVDIEKHFYNRINTLIASSKNIYDSVCSADLVIGAVLIPGASAPKLVSSSMLTDMKVGAVMVDISIDQGGCFATSRPTTHANPTFVKDKIVHYCVTNMPGALARTSSLALTSVTLPYVMRLASKGLDALRENSDFMKGLNVYEGHITCKPVADSLGIAYKDTNDLDF